MNNLAINLIEDGLDHRFDHFGRVGTAHRFLRAPLLVGNAHPTFTPSDLASDRNDDQGLEDFNTGHAGYISSLQDKIEKLRNNLYSYSKYYPAPLDSILVNHYQERLRCADKQPMIGEYGAFIIGDLLSIEPRITEYLAFPWLLLYEYSLLLDDLLDKSRSHWSHELLLSQMLLESSLNEYRKLLGDNQQVWSAYESYRRESIDGMLYEIEWSTRIKKHSGSEVIIQQGRKAAMVKFCAASMVCLDNNRTLTPKEEKGIDHLCAGIQLLDDSTDALEDHMAGRMNILLEETYEWFKKNIFNSISNIHPKDIGGNQLMVGLVYSGGISRSWKTATEQLDKAIELLADKGSQVANYLNAISIRCRKSSIIIDEALEANPELQEVFFRALAKGDRFTMTEINSEKLSEVWRKIAGLINDGPKARN